MVTFYCSENRGGGAAAHLDLAESLAEGPALEEVGVDARGEDEGAGAEVVGRHGREQQARLAAQAADSAPGAS